MIKASRRLSSDHAELTFGDPAKGDRLPAGLQRHMEGIVGVGLDAVRVHSGDLAPSLGANAVAHGTDIHFAPGRYNPEKRQGFSLVAHEIAHVAQQFINGKPRSINFVLRFETACCCAARSVLDCFRWRIDVVAAAATAGGSAVVKIKPGA